MKKVVKDPEIRREELIDIAEELFLTRGYDETPVSEIVKKAQVAQGTFYYYFKSKDEVLDALVDRYLQEFVTHAEELVHKNDMNAVEKLINFFLGGSRFSLGRKQLMMYLHEEKNALLHLKFERRGSFLIIPPLQKVIEQGVKDGLFDTKYPRETALLIVGCMDSLFDVGHFFEKTPEERKRSVEAAFHMMEKVLGARHGCLAEYFLNLEGAYEQ